MNFLAVLLALAVERLFAGLLQWRRLPLLAAYGRYAAGRLVPAPASGRLWQGVLYAALPAAAVALVALQRLTGLGHVLYAAIVLLFALGPDGLYSELSGYISASRAGRPEAATLAADLLADDACQRTGAAVTRVADAVLVQANNRLFGVLFWFALLGPAGAVLFRVTDVLRRAAIADASGEVVAGARDCAVVLQRLHGWLAFVPARLLALSYGVAGSFDDAFRGWRSYLSAERREFFEANDLLLVHAGQGALGAAWQDAADDVERAELVQGLLRRSLVLWLAVLAAIMLLTEQG
jgi:AmpE protein